MAVLVTGGAGYIGSHMVWRLLDQGEEVVVLDRLSSGFDWAVPADAELVLGDVSDQSLVVSILRKFDIDAVFHFAGSVIVPESVSDPLGYYLNNTVGSRSLIEAVVRCSVPHFIFSSTAAVYGTPETSPVPEGAMLNPTSPYGRSKLMTEMILDDVANAHDLTYTILRYFNVAGADPGLRTGQSTEGATHLIKVAAEVATGRRPELEVYGSDYPTRDGTCIRDYIHVADLVEAHAAALNRLRAGNGNLTVNCGYGRGYSVFEVIDSFKRVSGREFPVSLRNRREGDLVSIAANCDLVRSELGWKPLYDDLDAIVAHALAWEKYLQTRNC